MWPLKRQTNTPFQKERWSNLQSCGNSAGDLFGMVKTWPFQWLSRLSDLQPGIYKGHVESPWHVAFYKLHHQWSCLWCQLLGGVHFKRLDHQWSCLGRYGRRGRKSCERIFGTRMQVVMQYVLKSSKLLLFFSGLGEGQGVIYESCWVSVVYCMLSV